MYTDQNVNQTVWNCRLANITYMAAVDTEIVWMNAQRESAGKHCVKPGRRQGSRTLCRASSNTRTLVQKGSLRDLQTNVTLTPGYEIGPSSYLVFDIEAPPSHHWELYELSESDRARLEQSRGA